jgi:hypothetical protein
MITISDRAKGKVAVLRNGIQHGVDYSTQQIAIRQAYELKRMQYPSDDVYVPTTVEINDVMKGA